MTLGAARLGRLALCLADGSLFDIQGTVTWTGQPNGSLTSRSLLILAAANLPLVAGCLFWLLLSHRRKPPGNSGALEGADPRTGSS